MRRSASAPRSVRPSPGPSWAEANAPSPPYGNAFCIIEPAMSGDWSSTIWSVVGPLFFFAIALIMVARHNKKVRS